MASNTKSGSQFFPHIQGLRAIAVASVTIFHIWPLWLSGGYVGVDIFFVISGYLITGLLVAEAEKSGTISLRNFYRRRFLRLAPLAGLVIVITLGFTLLLLPITQWKGISIEAIASALYSENWRLAWLSVDYLGAEDAPSPLQHYWSLSIEEQFYIFWPAVVIACFKLASWIRKPKRLVLFGIFSVFFVASLAASILLSGDAPSAYFVTHTRIWELALGGLLALLPSLELPRWFHHALALLALAVVVICCVLFNASTPFPGYMALAPTVATAVMIYCGRYTGSTGVSYVLQNPALIYLGDRSYSIYLWHWPVVIFYKSVFQPSLGIINGIEILVITLGLSALSKPWVEDAFRVRHAAVRSGAEEKVAPQVPSWHKAIVLVSILVPVIFASGMLYRVSGTSTGLEARPGAEALVSGVELDPSLGFVPDILHIKDDLPEVYPMKCHLEYTPVEPVPCRFGKLDSNKKVFLVGDSHAAQWVPALQAMADKLGWSLVVHTKSACPLTNGGRIVNMGRKYVECAEWGPKVLAEIRKEKPVLVITSQITRSLDPDFSNGRTMTDEVLDVWQEITAAGSRVVAIKDTPMMQADPVDCLAQNDPKDCTMKMRADKKVDFVEEASKRSQIGTMINLNDMICPKGICPAVIGGVAVWRDRHHLTATYARSLSSILQGRLKDSLK